MEEVPQQAPPLLPCSSPAPQAAAPRRPAGLPHQSLLPPGSGAVCRLDGRHQPPPPGPALRQHHLLRGARRARRPHQRADLGRARHQDARARLRLPAPGDPLPGAAVRRGGGAGRGGGAENQDGVRLHRRDLLREGQGGDGGGGDGDDAYGAAGMKAEMTSPEDLFIFKTFFI